jgi:hypothetical protein
MNKKNMEDMMGMMPDMTGGCKGPNKMSTPQMMMEMMPQGLNMMLSRLPHERRADVLLTVIPELIEKACGDMAEQERMHFIDSLISKIKPEIKKRKK